MAQPERIALSIWDSTGTCLEKLTLPASPSKFGIAVRALRRHLEDGDFTVSELLEDFTVVFPDDTKILVRPSLSFEHIS